MTAFNRATVLRRALNVVKSEGNPAILKGLKTWDITNGFVCKRDFTDKQRKNAAKTGEAMPDGSFPIGNVEDLHNAVMLLHNAKDPSEAKEHIVRRATALGAESELPAAWGGGKKDKKPVKKDGEDMQNEPGDAKGSSEVEKVAAIVSTITTIQKDWAEFDANRAGHGLTPGTRVTAQGTKGTVSSVGKAGKFVVVAHDSGGSASYHHSQVKPTGEMRDTNYTMNHAEFNRED